MKVGAPDELVLDYTRAMMSFLLLRPQPRHIVMLGLGGGSIAKYCHAQLPHTRFTALEINPEVIALRQLFSIPDDDDRLQVVETDGADWLARHPQCCDVLLLDGFDADGLPEALCSQDFFDVCEQALEPGGVLASNVWVRPARRGVVIERMRASFSSGVATLSAEGGENTIALALRDADMPDLDTLHANARRLATEHPLRFDSTLRQLSQALG